MQLVALEEHHASAGVQEEWRRSREARTDRAPQLVPDQEVQARLADLGAERLAAMDAAGVDVAVLSLSTPGVQDLAPAEAVRSARASNDALASAVRAHPDRLAGFATLPTPDPAAAAGELERAVRELGFHGAMVFPRTGGLGGLPLDHPELRPVLAAAHDLRAPLYLHPQEPPAAVGEAYYTGVGDDVDALLATAGIGWHYDAGLQLLRLVLTGTFDRFPELQVVVGHWGELVLFYLERTGFLARVAGLELPLVDYVRRNVLVTPSGVWSQRYFRWAVEVIGADRVMWSTDYPFRFEPDGTARRFLEQTDLTDAEREAVASGTWERLVAGIRR